MTTLLNLLSEKGTGYDRCRQDLSVRDIPDLEKKVVDRYEQLKKQGLSNLHSVDVFTLHKETDDIEKKIMDEYISLVASFKKPKYKLRKDGTLRRILNKTSEWYNGHWDVHPEEQDLVRGLFIIGSVGATVGTAAIIAGGVGALAGIPIGLAIYYGMFKHETKLNGTVYEFKNNNYEKTILDAHRLHYIAQMMYEEAKDIELSDKFIGESIIEKYGEAVCLEHIERAKKEVNKVIDYTWQILDAAGIKKPILQEGYVPSGARQNELLKDMDLIDRLRKNSLNNKDYKEEQKETN